MVSIVSITTALVLNKGEAVGGVSIWWLSVVRLGGMILTVCWMLCEARECRSGRGVRNFRELSVYVLQVRAHAHCGGVQWPRGMDSDKQ